MDLLCQPKTIGWLFKFRGRIFKSFFHINISFIKTSISLNITVKNMAITCWCSRPCYLCEVPPDFKTHKSKSWPLRNMSFKYSRGCSIITKYQKLPVKPIKTKQILVINDSFCSKTLAISFMRNLFGGPQGPSSNLKWND